jgi:large repetitive protein
MRRKAERRPSFFDALNDIFSSARQRQQRRAKARRGRRPGFEMLEDRRLLAVTDLAMIQGLVFEDQTGDGYTVGEEVAGVEINLYLDDGDGTLGPEDILAATAVTDGNGIYRFENLGPGDYFVSQPAQTVGASSLANRTSPLITITAEDAAGTEVTILDSFEETAQSVAVSSAGSLVEGSSVMASEAIGGARDLFLELTSDTGTLDLDVNGFAPGRIEFQSSPTALGQRVITWDGPDDDPFNLDPTGLGGVDLTAGGVATSLSLTVGADQAGGEAVVRIYTDADNYSTATFAIPDSAGAATETLAVHFSDFVIVEGSGADLTNVGAIQMEIIGSAGYDGQVRSFSTLAPTVLNQDFDNLDKIDLQLTKTADTLTPVLESNVTFTITVTNLGEITATGVEVTDLLPVDLDYVTSTPSQGTYDAVTGLWDIGAIDVGEEATLELVAFVATLGAKVNTAEVTAADQPDASSTPGNNDPDENDQDSVTIVPASIDLSLTKTVDDSTPALNSDITFTIVVSNAGPGVATGIEVTDQLPEGLTFVSSDPSQGTYESNTGVWIVGTVEAGESATLQLIATVDTMGAKVNTAEVTAADQQDASSTPGNNDPDENDQDSVTVIPEGLDPDFIDLALTKTADVDLPAVGDDIVFTITVTNLGLSDATGVEVTDQLPAGLAFVSATPSQGTYDDATGVWTIGDIDSEATVTLELIVNASEAGTFTNVAEVTAADQPDASSTPGNNDPDENDQDSVTLLVGAIDLELTKTVDEMAPGSGENVTFTITVTNLGPHDATGVEVTDQLPAGLTFVSATPSQGSYDEVTGIWTIGDVASENSVTLELVATTSDLGQQVNSAEVTAADQPDLSSTPGNNDPDENDQDSAVIFVNGIDLELTKTADATAVQLGEDVTFTITVSNLGPHDATGVEVTDQLPAGLQFVSATPSQGTYDDATGVWVIGGIANGESVTLEIVATVIAPGENTNTAEVTAADQPDLNSTPGNNDPDENDQDSVTIITEAIDLELTKTVDNATPGLGTDITFTILVTNLGPSTATGVVVTDLLPEGLDFVSATPSQGTYDDATGVWLVGTIPSEEQVSLDIVATVSTIQTVINTAEVTAADQPDLSSTPGNNDPDENDQDSATVTPEAIELSLTKMVDNGTPDLGDNVTFTILVMNAGPSTATGVEVTDLLPAGLTFVSATTTQGTYDKVTGLWIVGTIDAEDNATLEITASVDTLQATVNWAEVTAADQPDLSSTPGNNDPTEIDQDSATVVPVAIDLQLSKSASTTTPGLGENVTFTILVTNGGPSTATGVAVTDLLPDGLTLVSNTTSQGTYDPATGIWIVGSIPNGGDATLELVATVDTLGEKVNVAEVTAADQPDPNSTPGNNDPDENDQDSVTVTPQAIDLELTKSVNNATPDLGSNVTFTIDVSNLGPSQATGVEVTDLLPAGLTFVSSTPSQGSYDAATGVWLVGTVDASANATLELVATVTTVGEKINTAEVTAADQPDLSSTPGNNDPDENDQDSASIVPVASDLSIAKSVSNTNPLVEDDITFTIIVSNAGPSSATGVTVLDVLPDGLDFVSSSASQGSYDAGTGVWTVGTLTDGADATLEIIANVATAGSKTNTAEILSADQPDPTPGNNQGSVTVNPQSGFSKRLFLAR